MLKWLRSLLGFGPKADSLPEAKGTPGSLTMYFGRVSPDGQWRWEWFQLPETLASATEVGDQVVELRIRKDLAKSPLVDTIRASLRGKESPSIRWVDQV